MRPVVLLLGLCGLSFSAQAIQIQTPQTAASLIQNLLDDPQACQAGSFISNCQYTGAPEAAGLFTDGLSSGFAIDTGIMLSTGKVADAPGPNLSAGKTFNYNSSGDTDLNTLSGTGSTRDAAVLEFDFQAQGESLSFQYVFASEEYNEFVNSNFKDVFGFFLNDVNTPNTKINLTSISINNINKNSNSGQFVNNDFKDFNQVAPFATEYDGFTTLIEASEPLVAGQTYHMKLAIADVRDSSFDSAVMIKSFATVPPELQVFENLTELFNGQSSLDFGTLAPNSSATKTLSLRNTQAGTLLLNGLTLPAGFSLNGTLPTEIAGNSSITIQIQFDAQALGAVSGQLSLASNDADENPFVLSLNAQVSAPAAVTTPTPTVKSIPTLSEWAMILLSLLLVGIAARRLRAYS